MTLSVYNEAFELIAQFDNYNGLSSYLGISKNCLKSYLSRYRYKDNKRIKNKTTDEFVFIRKDYFKEDSNDKRNK